MLGQAPGRGLEVLEVGRRVRRDGQLDPTEVSPGDWTVDILWQLFVRNSVRFPLKRLPDCIHTWDQESWTELSHLLLPLTPLRSRLDGAM